MIGLTILILIAVGVAGYIGYRIGLREGQLKGMMNLASGLMDRMKGKVGLAEEPEKPEEEDDYTKNVERPEIGSPGTAKMPTPKQVQSFIARATEVLTGKKRGYVLIGTVVKEGNAKGGQELQMGGGVYIGNINNAVLLSSIMASIKKNPSDFRRVAEMSEIRTGD